MWFKFILFSLIVTHLLSLVFGLKFWPLNSYDMFTNVPTHPSEAYFIEIVTKEGKAHKSPDFSKVSFEIYKNLGHPKTDNEKENLGNYLSKQALQIADKNNLELKSASLIRKTEGEDPSEVVLRRSYE